MASPWNQTGIPMVHWPFQLTESLSPRYREETLSLKLIPEEIYMTLSSSLHIHPPMCTFIHENTQKLKKKIKM